MKLMEFLLSMERQKIRFLPSTGCLLTTAPRWGDSGHRMIFSDEAPQVSSFYWVFALRRGDSEYRMIISDEVAHWHTGTVTRSLLATAI